MTAAPRSLLVIVHAPPLGSDAGRPLAMVNEMERSFPGLHLKWTISDEGHLVPLADRDAWVAQRRTEGGFPLVCNGDEGYRATLSAWESSADISSGRQAQLEVHAELPLDAAGIAAAKDVLEGIAESARAFWGRVLPDGVAVAISKQFRRPLEEPHPPHGLPAIKLPWHLRSPEIPHFLGWLNYWSAATARAIGFPDAARDAELLSRSRRTATGGWVVQLTHAPLDLEHPAHVEALLRAYERFPEIGGRADP